VSAAVKGGGVNSADRVESNWAEVMLAQSEKAYLSIAVTDDGRPLRDVMPVQSSKANSPIVVREEGRWNDFTPKYILYASCQFTIVDIIGFTG
jgi:hypothetical protein